MFKFYIYIILLLLVSLVPDSLNGTEPSEDHFRIGFSDSMFTDVNENDARAAVRLWGESISQDHNIPTDPDPILFKGTGSMLRSLKTKNIDALGITILEYYRLRHGVIFSPIFLTHHSGHVTERYVLLTHKKSRIKTPADLAGSNLQLHLNPRNCLAGIWLDTLLAGHGKPMADHFVGDISRDTQISKVVLPVFFQQADACIVTRNGFDTMAELNPQISRQLTVIAESSEIVPTVFAFRADYQPIFINKLMTGIKNLKTTPAGRQVLTIFQCEDISEHPVSRLDTAMELIATHEQLLLKEKRP